MILAQSQNSKLLFLVLSCLRELIIKRSNDSTAPKIFSDALLTSTFRVLLSPSFSLENQLIERCLSLIFAISFDSEEACAMIIRNEQYVSLLFENLQSSDGLIQGLIFFKKKKIV